MFKSEKGLADALAAEMESILESDQHRSVFAKPTPVVKIASADEQEEENNDVQNADDGENAEKEEVSKSAKFQAAVKGVAKISEVLDELGLPKSSLATLNALNILVSEAEEHYSYTDDKEDDKEEEDDKEDDKDDDKEDDDKEDDKDDARDKDPVKLPKDMTKVPSDPEVKEHGTHHSKPQLDQYRKDNEKDEADDKDPVKLPKDMMKVPSDPDVKERGTHHSKPQLDQYRKDKETYELGDSGHADDYSVDGASEQSNIEQRLVNTDLHYDDDGEAEKEDENNAEGTEDPKAEGLAGGGEPQAKPAPQMRGEDLVDIGEETDEDVGENIRDIMEELGINIEDEEGLLARHEEEPGLMSEFETHLEDEYEELYEANDGLVVVEAKKWIQKAVKRPGRFEGWSLSKMKSRYNSLKKKESKSKSETSEMRALALGIRMKNGDVPGGKKKKGL